MLLTNILRAVINISSSTVAGDLGSTAYLGWQLGDYCVHCICPNPGLQVPEGCCLDAGLCKVGELRERPVR